MVALKIRLDSNVSRVVLRAKEHGMLFIYLETSTGENGALEIPIGFSLFSTMLVLHFLVLTTFLGFAGVDEPDMVVVVVVALGEA